MKKLNLVIILSLALQLSCSKPPLTPMGCDFTADQNNFSFKLDTANYSFPSFNPINPNEFSYAKEYSINGSGMYYSICKYNLQTQTGDTIRNWGVPTNYVEPPLTWGASGYIITSAGGDRIYRINTVTGEIILLSSIWSNVYVPIWSYDGNNILYTNTTTYLNYRVELMDINGNVLDTVHHEFYGDYMYHGTARSNGHYLALFDDLNLYEYDANLDSVAHYSINTNWTPCGAFQSNCYDIRGMEMIGTTDKILFSTPLAFYITDLSTSITTTIATTCETNPFYGDFSLSSDGQKILYTKAHLQKIGVIDYIVRRKIHLMNIDGTGDQIINLP